MTVAERTLWYELRARKLGAKFRSQQVVGPFILDFYCPERRLGIEVDGASHYELTEVDAVRDRQLLEARIKVLRFSNDEVLSNIAEVVSRICDEIERRPQFRY